MRRGVTQVLFNYTPDRTFDDDERIIRRAVSLGDEVDSSLDRDWVLRRTAGRARRWAVSDLPSLLDEPDRFALIHPRKVLHETFPLLFQCPDCGVVRRFMTSAEYKRAATRGVRCAFCNGTRLHQVPIVLVHRCGAIRTLQAPNCCDQGSGVALNSRGSRSPAAWRWQCRRCGNDLGRLLVRQCNCGMGSDWKERRMQLMPHKASSAYYAQAVSLLNVPGTEIAWLKQTPDWEEIVLGTYLVRAEDPSVHLQPPKNDTPSAEELLQRLAEAGVSLSAGDADKVRARHGGAGRAPKEEIARKAGASIHLAPENRAALAVDVLELLRIEDVLRTSRCADPALLQPGRWLSIDLVKDFPITHAVFGYTRTEKEPANTRLRAFRRLRDDRIPVFVHTVHTEALLFRLDPVAVYRWLRDNGVVTGPQPKSLSEMDIRKWFLERTPAPDGPRLDADSPTEMLLGLVHTMSHLVMRKLPTMTSFDTSSMGEYLFPGALAFAVYGKEQGSYSLGSLATLFEQNLPSLVQALTDNAGTCVFDPVCTTLHNGACHGCLHVPETSCTEFNQHLSRHLLFGVGSPNRVRGYWESGGAAP